MDVPEASHVGMDLLRAKIIAGVLTQGLKYAVGRERPNHTGDPAFPSGHAALTFATATVIERTSAGRWPVSATPSLPASRRLASTTNVHYAIAVDHPTPLRNRRQRGSLRAASCDQFKQVI
jgi:hypothetical protein